MDKGIDSILVKYLELIKDQYNDFQSAYLFGSYVKGKQTSESDIDIALVFAELKDEERFERQLQLMILASAIDSRIEPHPFSRVDFDSENPFAFEIRRTGTEIEIVDHS
jgi:predicted nucleotidyltransferase